MCHSSSPSSPPSRHGPSNQNFVVATREHTSVTPFFELTGCYQAASARPCFQLTGLPGSFCQVIFPAYWLLPESFCESCTPYFTYSTYHTYSIYHTYSTCIELTGCYQTASTKPSFELTGCYQTTFARPCFELTDWYQAASAHLWSLLVVTRGLLPGHRSSLLLLAGSFCKAMFRLTGCYLSRCYFQRVPRA